MSVIKFELKNEHISLLKALNWTFNKEIARPMVHNLDPFGNKDAIYSDTDDEDASYISPSIHEEMAYVLGIPHIPGTEKDAEGKQYDEEAKAKMDKLFEELPTAINIVMFTKSFQVGTYRTKFGYCDWKLETNK